MSPGAGTLARCKLFIPSSALKYSNGKYRFCLVALALLLILPFSARAQQDQSTELEALKLRIEDAREEMQGTRSRRDSAQQLLKRTETRIGKINRELRRLRRDSRAAKKNLQALKRQQVAERKSLSKQRDLLGSQIRARYVMGRQEQIKILLNQTEPSRVQRVLVYYDYLNRARLRNIASVNRQLEKLLTLETDILLQQKKLGQLLQTRKQARSDLKSQRKQRKKILTSLNKKLKNKQVALQRLLENERRLQQVISDINDLNDLNDLRETTEEVPQAAREQRPFSQLKGKLRWPTEGRLRARFGKRRSGRGDSWKGVLISAASGQPVSSVAYGRVAFADWLRGYGLLVIVDHGDGYMSLYGHNQSIYMEVGEWVDAGSIIASVGDSGGQTRTALYYEIRQQGQPIDPQAWSATRKPSLARTASRP
ncbi:MAG TPA: peptidase M23 [Gammaproteobacteria bacterium]|nr:peptidase M23 [Gammaproteobacteria bacterium]